MDLYRSSLFEAICARWFCRLAAVEQVLMASGVMVYETGAAPGMEARFVLHSVDLAFSFCSEPK